MAPKAKPKPGAKRLVRRPAARCRAVSTGAGTHAGAAGAPMGDGGLPGAVLGGTVTAWSIMDRWQDPALAGGARALLTAGHLLEVKVTSPGGRVLGHMLFTVIAAHPPSTTGLALEVKHNGSSNVLASNLMNRALANGQMP
eukprot:2596575-Amphidinium_carterae.1